MKIFDDDWLSADGVQSLNECFDEVRVEEKGRARKVTPRVAFEARKKVSKISVYGESVEEATIRKMKVGVEPRRPRCKRLVDDV